ncbi:zinc finger CCCH domain-containing protein 14 isoform X2 [Ziziphus jujuba]|uniref:Zinc finger CCCH domain-containing protein 14 isoform X2 n=2 Tax=Ziziphus jujuba TaxID=326968 RepID=A0ABM4A635_ZIZJJ|nr:zinc finger CCCH domain-containing protein 14 isoform X2 [Ziziphus jujuba]KAH7533923.1 hypothetical protein FEM48_Zijuj04G0183100 [Ziziphus jujuba var. spinosa]
MILCSSSSSSSESDELNMETEALSASAPSETNTASTNSSPHDLFSQISTYSNFPAPSQENGRDFGADFASMYRAIFPPNFPSSLSLTPSTTHSSSCGEDEAAVTEHRLNQACLILECQELRDGFDLCRANLHEITKEVEYLRRENSELRSANTELVKLLSSQTTFQSVLLSSSYPNRSFMQNFRRLNIGGTTAPNAHGSEEVSNISPTSVMENNRFQRRSNTERINLPKSISVRSSGYPKLNQSASASNVDGPSRISTRPQVTGPLVSGSQRVYVPAGCGSGSGKRDQDSEGGGDLELEVYNQGMFKTELCNKWQETGTCPYGDHCQFAHGIKELRPIIRHPRYKTEVCRMVMGGDRCPYGHRCHFRHSLTEQERVQLMGLPRAN